MGQNRSSAVMQQRVELADGLDYFPTPPWATRALFEHVLTDQIKHLQHETVWEPACGEGHMAKPLSEYFGRVITSDIADYRETFPEQGYVHDFTGTAPLPDEIPTQGQKPQIVTNPPFNQAEAFVRQAQLIGADIALLVRTAFLEGVKRHGQLFSVTPPSIIAQFSERVPMVKGRLDRRASSATAYCWLYWRYWQQVPGSAYESKFVWIPPCRKKLERPYDYPHDGQVELFAGDDS